ncbi:hypothetical protein H0E87_008026, partial [Populus deltoides]
VAKQFRQVFSELVQGGHGYLAMMKKKDVDNRDNNYDDDGPHEIDLEGRVVKYVGVIMKYGVGCKFCFPAMLFCCCYSLRGVDLQPSKVEV